MMRSKRAAVFCGIGMLATMVGLAQSPDKPIRLFAEAEDFKVVKGEWAVVPFRENYFASTFAITFLSRMACLGAPGQVAQGKDAVAEQLVTIPHDGEFEVLARYEQPYDFSVEFTVEVEQKGKVLYKETFGRLTDPKIWGCSGDENARRAPMQRFFWGATDNIVWQEKGAAKLAAGAAIVRMTAAPQMDGNTPRLQAARRNVDVICLTDDKAGRAAQRKNTQARTYLELDGWLVQDGGLYIRIKNLGQAPVAPELAPDPGGQHSPYTVHLRDWAALKVLKSGYAQSATTYELAGPRSTAVAAKHLAACSGTNFFKTQPEDQKLPPGAVSGWVPMGQLLDALHDSTWTFKTPQKLGLEFAIPDGKGGLKTVKALEVSGTTTFEMPGNLAPNPALEQALKNRWWLPVIRTVPESLTWLKGEVARFPDKGPAAKRFLIYNIMGWGGLENPIARELTTMLGDNTMLGQEGKKRKLVCHLSNPDPTWVNAELAKGKMNDTYIVSYGDETHLPAVKPDDATFRAGLAAHGVKGREAASYTTDRNSPLFYYSKLCAIENGAQQYIAGTAAYSAKGILTGANYAPHSNYLVSEINYIRTFKLKAMSMPWSEDYVWQVPEFSIQVMGYVTSAFRAGAKYNNLPIHMYVMPHSPGNTPKDFRLSFYTCVAHGAKMINYFCASPLAVAATENYVATSDLAMWRAIYDCSHAAGQFEDYVMDGQVRPAQVGLLLSSVDDIMTGADNTTLALHNNERKAIYYALRHAQVPVDFLSEDDVIDGLAKNYKVIYVTQQWLHSKAVTALRKWAEAGGTVVALAGGGFLDEFNKPNPEAGALYGIKAQQLNRDPKFLDYILIENKPFLSKQDLPRYKPFATATLGEGERKLENIGVIAWKQDLTTGDGKLLGKFSDGKPAMVEKTHGKGKAVLFAFLPGQEYLRKALPLQPTDRGSCDSSFTHFIPTAMDPALRRALVDDFLPADFVRPVSCSEALVESTCIDTLKPVRRLAVTLINYSGKPVPQLTVTIHGVTKASKLRSVEQAKLEYKTENGNLVVTLPLDVADMLLIEL
ncbi:MAG: hypothetical protein WCL16_00085 [bacterium]